MVPVSKLNNRDRRLRSNQLLGGGMQDRELMEARTLRLKEGGQFVCGSTSFECSAGKVVFLRQVDERNRKVLLDFGGRLVDWFHVSVLDRFDTPYTTST